MAGSSIGSLFRLTTFGESHGPAIGGVIDGFPPNVNIDLKFIQSELNKRRPGQSNLVTARNETDQLLILSGVFEGKSTGTPIGFMIQNKDAKSKDYEHLKNAYRPSHADFVYDKKYGHRDYLGGGRSSARETASRVVAGAFAKLFLSSYGITITAFVDQVGNIRMNSEEISAADLSLIESNDVRCPHLAKASLMEELIKKIRKQGDTIGGAISCSVSGVPIGLGEPVFDKLNADIGKAILSINAVKGIEFGDGFDAIELLGSEHNDLFFSNGQTHSNHSGGIVGGISNGMPILFRVAFKPVATLLKDQLSINSAGEEIILKGKGRHDACVVPRAVVIVEAMTAIVLLDHLLRNNVFKR
jgi:chorismate synthase